jgi:hypothetical protein
MKKAKLYLTPEEWRTTIEALNDLRNKRIREGKCIDTVNDTLFTVVNAKTKRIWITG